MKSTAATLSVPFHADGHRDFMKAAGIPEIARREEIRLRRRLRRWCRAKSPVGALRIWMFRRRMICQLRREMALF